MNASQASLASTMQAVHTNRNVPQSPDAQEAQGTAANGATVKAQHNAQPQLADQANQSKTGGTSQPENKPVAERQASKTTNGDNPASVKPEQQTDSTSSKSEDASFFGSVKNLFSHGQTMFTGYDTLIPAEAKTDNPKSETPSKAGQPSAAATAKGADKTEPQASLTGAEKSEPQASSPGAEKSEPQASSPGAEKSEPQASSTKADKPVETSAQASSTRADKPQETSARASSEGVVDNSITEEEKMAAAIEAAVKELKQTQHELNELMGVGTTSEDIDINTIEQSPLYNKYKEQEAQLENANKQIEAWKGVCTRMTEACNDSINVAAENQSKLAELQKVVNDMKSSNEQFNAEILAQTEQRIERARQELDDLKHFKSHQSKYSQE